MAKSTPRPKLVPAMTQADVGNIVAEYCSLKKSAKVIENSLNAIKAKLMGIPDKLWGITPRGGKFIWSDTESFGVQLISPQASPKLNRDKALAYVQKKKLAATKEVLDEEKFLEMVEKGTIKSEVVAGMMEAPEKPPTSYLKEMSKPPSEEE